ncbi:two component transcriptional regulator, LuxR family [Paracidovorax avenae ATCC 19860]|uniref:Two component transcriptional regulator, LuxR family n=2 Tax=Comamonadaceae TaxID=80864 RepID=F0QAT0_PARA1|nr:two component transcriptional regulator, LuxR family [Paracidovorax avenae ATCC 19860]
MTDLPSPFAPHAPAAGRAAPLMDSDSAGLVLVVDDVPDNLAVLHDALDESGYTVLVATSGETALARAAQAMPDVVLLDAMMPGMDGFEVARRLKAQPATAHIPIIFMTGLTETEHLEAALAAGGVDYVTKPIKPREVLARMHVHLQGARRARQDMRQAGQARNALDAFGYASITVRASDGRLMWQTALARTLLREYFSTEGAQGGEGAEEAAADPVAVPLPVAEWLRAQLPQVPAFAAQQIEPPRLVVERGARRLSFSLHQQTGDSEGGGDWLIVMREVSDAAVIEALALGFRLTAREAEVLYWLLKGKTNRDIGDILGSSPATVKKHLERVYVKLGVETRTAAAGIAMARIRQTHPQFEG